MRFHLMSVMPVCMIVLMQEVDGANGSAGARLVDQNGELKAEVPGAIKPKQKGMLGDPTGFTCVATHRMEGYVTKKAPDILQAEVGTVNFETVHGVKMTARVIKHQKRTIEENGRIVGKGPLELTFAQSFARSTPSVTITSEGEDWMNGILEQWKAYRDANRYPVVLLVKPEAGSAAGSNVED